MSTNMRTEKSTPLSLWENTKELVDSSAVILEYTEWMANGG